MDKEKLKACKIMCKMWFGGNIDYDKFIPVSDKVSFQDIDSDRFKIITYHGAKSLPDDILTYVDYYQDFKVIFLEDGITIEDAVLQVVDYIKEKRGYDWCLDSLLERDDVHLICDTPKRDGKRNHWILIFTHLPDMPFY